MGRKIKEKEFIGGGKENIQTLILLYLYEKLVELDEKIDQEDILAYFSNTFNANISSSTMKQIEVMIHDKLKQIRMNHFGNKLKSIGYTAIEFE
jgi:hypothetical protein